MKNLVTLAASLTMLFIIGAPLKAKAENGGKGGGIIRVDDNSGTYITFDKYRLKVRSVDESDIPALQNLITSVVKMDLPEYYKGDFLQDIIPGTNRHYFLIDSISAEEEARLVAIYKSMIHAPSGVAVAAVTVQRDTFLIRKRFENEANDFHREKTLFHEALWADGYPIKSYQDVVNAEVTYGEYLQNRQFDLFPTKLYLEMTQILNDPGLLLASALIYDLRKGNIDAINSSGIFLNTDNYWWRHSLYTVGVAAEASNQYPNVATFKALMKDQNINVRIYLKSFSAKTQVSVQNYNLEIFDIKDKN